MNMGGGVGESPFFDDEQNNQGRQPGRALVNGQPYTNAELDKFVLSGDTPYEASAEYSATLKDAIRGCLRYHPHERVKLETLKDIIEENRDEAFENVYMSEPLVVRYNARAEQFPIGSRYRGGLAQTAARALERAKALGRMS